MEQREQKSLSTGRRMMGWSRNRYCATFIKSGELITEDIDDLTFELPLAAC
jgi:hypothetical protein